MTTTKQNQLAQEASLYLQQHADNPVNWYPWGEAVLTKAKEENKPILLSIGYSACHWCHVMAVESFADPAIARIMNEHFVNIKVDREERPDVDKIYQLAQQLLTGRGGGWPLTMFLSPQDQTPFFGGTYFPPEPKYGMPSFKEVLLKIAELYRTQAIMITQQNVRVQQALQHLMQHSTSDIAAINAEPIQQAAQQLLSYFDKHNGGFGRAPKFPQTPTLVFLLQYCVTNSSEMNGAIKQMLALTLTKMAHGGIYDQIGGGFYRYAVDEYWQIPHFEKMLYDNAQLLDVYVQAAIIFNNAEYKKIAIETGEWILRDMISPKGAFYATLDADAEHIEGKFYYWDQTEIQQLLTAEEYAVAAKFYNLQQPANFEQHWHLHITRSLMEVATILQIDLKQAEEYLQSARHKLLQARNKKIWPGRDEKILTSWNSLAIKGLAIAGHWLNKPEFLQAAFRAVDFIRKHLLVDGRLYATFQKQAGHAAYLDDHAFLLETLVTLLQIEWREQDLDLAVTIAELLLKYFIDDKGGFFFTAVDQEKLLERPKSFTDDALPAGNSIAADALATLGHLLGETRYIAASEKALQAAWQQLSEQPTACASWLPMLTNYLTPPQLVIIRGSTPELVTWQQACQLPPSYQRHVFAIPSNINFLPGILSQYKAMPEQLRAYVCIGQRCSAPIEQLNELKSALQIE